MNPLKNTLMCCLLLLSGSIWAQSGFIENKGQFHSQVNYEADFSQHRIYLDQEGFTVLLHDEQKWEELIERYHGHEELKKKHNSDVLGFQSIKYIFLGADLSNAVGSEKAGEYYNYFIGNDPSKWASEVAKYRRVVFKDVYPNIDIEFLAIDQRFKYNFILHPGADVEDIRFAIKGADGIEVKDEAIEIETRFGSFSEIMPISYRLHSNGEREQVQFKYKQFSNGDIGIAPGPDNSMEGAMLVDPELVFSTYAGNSVDNFGFTATFDSDGNLYAGGIAAAPSFSIPNGRYPVTAGAFDISFNGGEGREPANLACDIAISKYDSTGAKLMYATYLGGSDDEYPHSLVVNKQQELIVFGTSYSDNYPLATIAPQNENKGGTDLIITKFNTAGSGIVGSTYLGGWSNDGLNQSSLTKYFYADDFRGEVNLDSNGNIFIATSTSSSNFPVTADAFQKSKRGGQEGIIACLSPDVQTLLWASYFGGAKDDAVYSIDVAHNGDLYISGGTASDNLSASSGSLGASYNGGRTDGFVARIKADGKNLVRSAYYGTSKYDQILQLEIDKYGNVFVVGQSVGSIPTKGNVYKNGGSGQFISKFDEDLEEVLLSTVYGSGNSVPEITVNAFLVDECDKIFVSGWGGSLYVGPQAKLKNMPITNDAFQKTTDGNDFHLAVFRKDFKDLVYATYFGGNLTDDHVDGGTSRFDKKGVIYQSVCSSCPPSSDGQTSKVSDFPTTSGAFSETNLSPRCSNASFKFSFGNLNRKPELKEEIYEVYATDTLNFTYRIHDPDEDTLNAWIDYTADVGNDFINRQDHYMGVTDLNVSFTYNPGCELIGDTLSFPVYSLDVGCPAPKDSSSLFKIIINPPPLLPAPDVICLNFLDKDALKLEWNATPASKYFKEMRLYKIGPNGQTQLLQTYYSQQAGSFTDSDVVSPRTRNYTYYMVVLNICDLVGPKSYDVSSVKEHEIPVTPTYLKTVTVDQGKIRVEWLKSVEDDFGHYELYKSKRGTSETVFLTTINHIDSLVYIDEQVNVDEFSYCYQVRVSDDCGHLSVKSNIGCSIVIRGKSLPFKFDLNWDDYLEWNAGVQDYELLRANDVSELLPIVRTNWDNRIYLDSDLDYDWGGYWYSVIAYEAPGSEDAQSRSNDIYLIQPPLLHVPNAVTANGDNLNDVFSWSDVFVLDFNMKVYNRWGEKVFETEDKNADWDGFYKDNELRNGNVYIWVAEYTGWDRTRHTQRGTVTFIR